MSVVAARFFTLVQGAGFYRGHLADAVALLPPGRGRTLLDVGCGPGLLSRLAAARGYDALGIDSDAAMVATARRLAARERSPASFARRGLHDAVAEGRQADVVAAASLLAVVPDREAALDALWACVRPGGTLLVVEATERLTVAAARDLLAAGVPGPRRGLLATWAAARAGRSVPAALYDRLRATDRHTEPLLGGLAGAHVFRKPPAAATTPNAGPLPLDICRRACEDHGRTSAG